MTSRRIAIGLTAMTLAAASGGGAAGADGAEDLLARVDHLVYATPDLNRGIEEIEKLVGVRATAGGQHPGRGTRNALISLGPSAYLEIIAPDPDQPAPETPRAFGIDGLTKSKLAAWAARGRSIDEIAAAAARGGVPLGEVASGSRRRPDGVLLSWRYTDPRAMIAGGVVPFFIDWGDSPHPAATAARGATLIGLSAEHPDASRVQGQLRELGLPLAVKPGPAPALIAIVRGPLGRVELR